MDQVNLIEKLNGCIDHHKVLKLQIEWLDGKAESVLFQPYLIGDCPVSAWTFIYGKALEKNILTSFPVPFIVSFEETGESFVVAGKDKTFLVSDNVKNKVIKSISDMQILDISEPEEEEEEEDEVLSCPFCDVKYNCEHLVFEYDLSFNEFKAGRREELDQLRKVIIDVFSDLIAKKKDLDFKFEDSYPTEWILYCRYFNELWGYSKDRYKSNDNGVEIDDELFMRFIELLFLNLETVYELVKKTYPEGQYAAGFDSAMLGYYAKDPSLVFQTAKTIIQEFLEAFQKNQQNRQ